MSVENFTFSHLTPNCLFALSLLLIGSMADIVLLCNVAFRVAFALSVPIPNQYAGTSADILGCLLVEEYVCLVGISSGASSNLVVLDIVFGIVACSCALILVLVFGPE